MNGKLKDLPYSDDQHLEAAEGWLELGNWLEANDELELITPQWKAHPYVLELRYKIYEAAGKPELAAEIARGMSAMLPDNPWGPFRLAFSLHELKRIKEAYDTLIPVMDKFPNEWLMQFNLACYACRLGKLEEAMKWLGKAVDVAGKKEIRELALEDLDLKPLWPEIAEI